MRSHTPDRCGTNAPRLRRGKAPHEPLRRAPRHKTAAAPRGAQRGRACLAQYERPHSVQQTAGLPEMKHGVPSGSGGASYGMQSVLTASEMAARSSSASSPAAASASSLERFLTSSSNSYSADGQAIISPAPGPRRGADPGGLLVAVGGEDEVAGANLRHEVLPRQRLRHVAVARLPRARKHLVLPTSAARSAA